MLASFCLPFSFQLISITYVIAYVIVFASTFTNKCHENIKQSFQMKWKTKRKHTFSDFTPKNNTYKPVIIIYLKKIIIPFCMQNKNGSRTRVTYFSIWFEYYFARFSFQVVVAPWKQIFCHRKLSLFYVSFRIYMWRGQKHVHSESIICMLDCFVSYSKPVAHNISQSKVIWNAEILLLLLLLLLLLKSHLFLFEFQ